MFLLRLVQFEIYRRASCDVMQAIVSALFRSQQVDPVAQHFVNLTSPSTPFFFNTLYDP